MQLFHSLAGKSLSRLVAVFLGTIPVWGISHTLKTTIHHEVGAPNLGGSWSATTTTDQSIEWGTNPDGTQTVVHSYYPWYVQAYGITSRTTAATYNADGSSSAIYSSTGPNAIPPYTINPALAPVNIPWRKWNRTAPDSSFTNQTTTVELRPIATGTETSSTYGLFVVSVAATSATGTAIPPGQITIAGQAADAQGKVYLSYQLDGVLRTITPTISGYTDYEFNLSVQPAKLVISFGNPTPAEPIPVWVSDRIDVSVSLEPPVASIDPGTYSWQVDGTKVSKFNHLPTNGGPVSWTDPKTDSTTFTWVSGTAQGSIQGVIAQAKVKGQFLHSRLNFSVTRPVVSPVSLFPCPNPDIGYPSANPWLLSVGLIDGCPSPTPPATVPAGFFSTSALGQNVFWVQVISSAQATIAVYRGWSVTRTTTGLDSRFPYSSDPYTDDSPTQPLWYPQPTPPDVNWVRRVDSFSTFLMLARSGTNFAVPIGRVDWNWNAIAQKNAGSWSLTYGYKNITFSQPSSSWPMWTKTAEGSELNP